MCFLNSAAKVLIVGSVLTMNSSPKLTVPQSRLAISGSMRAMGRRRSSGVSPTAPPVVISTMMSVFFRTDSITSLKRSGLAVGEPSSLRTWRWRMAAPALRASTAARVTSSTVTGRAGFWALVVSAPVQAQVMIILPSIMVVSYLAGYFFAVSSSDSPMAERALARSASVCRCAMYQW